MIKILIRQLNNRVTVILLIVIHPKFGYFRLLDSRLAYSGWRHYFLCYIPEFVVSKESSPAIAIYHFFIIILTFIGVGLKRHFRRF